VLIATPLIILAAVVLRATGYGLAARATARTATGRGARLRVKRVSLIVWVIAACSRRSGLLEAPVVGFQFGAIAVHPPDARAAAAVIGRMENLVVTFGAPSSSPPPTTLFAGTGKSAHRRLHAGGDRVALLVQRRRSGDSSDELELAAVQEVRPVPVELRSLPEVRSPGTGSRPSVLARWRPAVLPLAAQRQSRVG